MIIICDVNFVGIVAYYDIRKLPVSTIRHKNCEVLLSLPGRCHCCDEYRYIIVRDFSNILCFFCRKTLHSMASRESNRSSSASSLSSHINYRYLSSSEKDTRLGLLRQKNRILESKVKRLTAKLDSILQTDGIDLDDETSSDFISIMEEEDAGVESSFPPDSFQHIFWKHQLDSVARSGKKKNGVRWHPLMIKFCIYLRHVSSKSYEVLRQSGVIHLPSQRTLKDYTNCVKASPGFSHDVDAQLLSSINAKSCPSWHKLVILLLDEMHIKEGLVYDKHTGRMIGFVDLGDINNHLLEFERSLETDSTAKSTTLASSVMVIMVKGLFTPLRFPYSHFPCTSITGDLLFDPFWEAIYRLERMDFKVSVLLKIYIIIMHVLGACCYI